MVRTTVKLLPGVLKLLQTEGFVWKHGTKISFSHLRSSQWNQSKKFYGLMSQNQISQMRCFATRSTEEKTEQEERPKSVKKKSTYTPSVSSDRKQLLLTGTNDKVLNFNATWLRYQCTCMECTQSYSGQKLIEPFKMRETYTLNGAHINDGEVTLSWEEDPDHIGKIALAFLEDNHYSKENLNKLEIKSTPTYLNVIPEISFKDISSSKEGLLRLLKQVNDYGLSVVRGVSTEDGMVKKVAELIWPVQSTIYGEVFDVVSVPKPINVAYSSSYLGFHMDLIYYESPPGLQFLHCVRFDDCVEGGESIFVDSFHAAEELRKNHPQDFATLLKVPATFQKIHSDREHPVHMKYQRPHIVVNQQGVLIAVNWSPAFEGPLWVPEEDIEPYYIAYNKFAKILQESPTLVEFRMKPGDMTVFNNRRILHARQKIILNGGQRHLQGCYINIDEFKSQAKVFQELYGTTPFVIKRVGNQDYH